MYVCMYVNTCILGRTYSVERSIHLIEEHWLLIITGVQASGVIIVYVCMYVCMYIWVYVFVYVCMYVYHRICVDFKYGLPNRGSFVRTLRKQIKSYVENFKPGRNPVSYRKPRFCKRKVWMQVKVQNSRELKRYVSQNISSNSWNSTVNAVGVLAKFVFSQALLYLFNW